MVPQRLSTWAVVGLMITSIPLFLLISCQSKLIYFLHIYGIRA